ncbi:MAG: type III-B CRISPR module-associated protein Cmr5 [Anaerolineae bacterium]|nr:type III-B CRISPR module-associated protein Cmr5 [Anaerolineae bacterium]MDW8068807.1 type III-B CRISPR module-associated protein Cmr5 [Anaerolineae bacterium]
MSVRRTMEQERAERAWQAVREVQKEKQKEYLALARSAPADIQNSGLAQTLAFWRAKGDIHHKALYKHVSEWVMERLGAGKGDLLTWITDARTSSDQYRRATVEALAFLVWIKRFAEAEFK